MAGPEDDEDPFSQASLLRGIEQKRAARDAEVPTEKFGPDLPTDDFFPGVTMAPTKLSGATSYAHGAAGAAVPVAAGVAGAGVLAAGGAALGAAIGGPFAPVTGAVGGLLGAVGGALGFFAGGWAGEKAQEWAFERTPEDFKEFIGQSDRQKRLDQEIHPNWYFAGGTTAFAVTMSPRTLARGLPANAGSFTRAISSPFGQRALGGVSMGGFEVGMELAHGDVDWGNVAIATGFGMVFAKQNPLGAKIHSIGAAPFEPLLRRADAKRARLVREAEYGMPSNEDWANLEPRLSEDEWHASSPTMAEANEMNVLGLGNTEAVFLGVHERSPATALTAHEVMRTEQSVIGPERAPDLHAVAERLDPDMTRRWDELRTMRDRLVDWIGGRAAPTDLALLHAEDSRAALERRLNEVTASGYTGGREARQLRALLRDAERQVADLTDRRQMAGLPEYREKPDVTMARQHLVDIEQQMHGMSGEMSALYRRASDHAGVETVPTAEPVAAPPAGAIAPVPAGLGRRHAELVASDEMQALRAEGRELRSKTRPTVAERARLAEIDRQIKERLTIPEDVVIPVDPGGTSMERWNKIYQGALAEGFGHEGAVQLADRQIEKEFGARQLAGETPAATTPPRTIEQQQTFIAEDAERRYRQAFPHRPAEEAQRWAQLVAHNAVTMAQRMEGRAGTPEEFYLREAPGLRGPDGQVLPPGAPGVPELRPEGALEYAQDGDLYQTAAPFKETRNERALTVNDILDPKTPALKARSRTVEDIARELMKRGSGALKKLGVAAGRIEGPDPKTDEILSRAIAAEIIGALRREGRSAIDWYTHKVREAMAVASAVHPELASDPHARFGFTASLAITSQGETVPSNVRLGEAAYTHFKQTGRFPTDVAADKQIHMNGNFRKLNELLDALGPDGAREFLNKEWTVKELSDAGHAVGGENMGTRVHGSAILGPKIGQGFFQNLNGNYKPVTMDLWFMRAWGRLAGTLVGKTDISKPRARFEAALTEAGEKVPRTITALEKLADDITRTHERDFARNREAYNTGSKKKSELTYAAERLLFNRNGINETPSSGSQRVWMRDRVERAREILAAHGINVTNADLQAIWWYPEKDLYSKLGGRDSEGINVDYSQALRDLAARRGIEPAAIEAAVRTVDQRPGSTGAADVGRAAEDVRAGREGAAGEGAPTEGVDLHQAAYHGSPYRFDKFTLDHIGKGEGVQAYGWGLYFAGAKAVAKYYRDTLSRGDYVELHGERIADQHGYLAAMLRNMLDDMDPRHGHSFEQAKATALGDLAFRVRHERAGGRGEVAQEAQAAADAIKDLKQSDFRLASEGRLYHVDIPEDGAYLHWDKKLSEQSPEVQAALGKLGIEDMEMTGQRAYRILQERLTPPVPPDLPGRPSGWSYVQRGDEGQKGASVALREAGIPGIQYLDQMSRGGGEGTHNYVLFDAEAAKIVDYEQRQRSRQVSRGMLSVRPGMRDVMHIFQEANASTGVHELFHHFLEQWKKYGVHEAASPGMRRDYQTILDSLGVKHGDDIGKTEHERFARWGEQYMRLGIAPSRELAGVFAGFRRWLTDLYQTIKQIYVGSGIPREHRTEISPQMREVIDRMLALKPERIAIAPEKPLGPTIADIHTADATHTPPAEAEATMTRAEAETTKTEAAAPPEVQSEIETKQAEAAAAAHPAGEDAAGGAQQGEVPAAGGAGSQPAGGALGAGNEPVVGGGRDVGTEGAAARKDAGGGDAGSEQRPGAGEGPIATDIAPRPKPDFSEQPARDVDKAGNVRLDNLPDVPAIRDAIIDSFEHNDDFRGVRSGDAATPGQKLDLADALGVRVNDINEEAISRLLGGTYGLDQRIGAIRKLVIQSAQAVSVAAKQAVASGSLEDYANAATAISRHDLITSALSGVTAEWGRAGRAFRKIEGEGVSIDLNQMLMQQTGRDLNQVQAITRMIAQADKEGSVSKMVRDSGKRGYWSMLLEYWINGLISGPVTHSTYVIGNLALSLNKIGPETAAAALIGRVRMATGRTGPVVHFNEIPQMLKGFGQAVAPALHAGGQAFRTGATSLLPGEKARPDMLFQPDMLGATPGQLDMAYRYNQIFPDLFGVMNGALQAVKLQAAWLGEGGGMARSAWFATEHSTLGANPNIAIKGVPIPIGSAIRLPSTTVAAIHSFNRALNYSAHIAGYAARQATEEGLIGEAWSRRVAELKADPSPDVMMGVELQDPADVRELKLRQGMQEMARTQSTELALMGQGGDFTRKLSALTNSRIAGLPILKFIDPFVTISSNVISKSLLERTPLGFIAPELRAELMGHRGTVVQDIAQGRMLVGTAYAVAFGALAAQGLITGSGPKDVHEAAMWRQAGNQPHSVRIGDIWYDVHRLGPLGMLLGTAADMYEVAHLASEGEMAKAAFGIVHAFAQNILDESFMRGPSDLMKALEEPDRQGQRWVSNFVSSFVPYSVGLAQMARASDPYSRQAHDIVSAIKNKFPGWSQSLLPRLDIWGQPISARDAAISPYLLAIYMTKINTDPVNQAMYKLGIFPTPVDKQIRNVELNDDQYYDYQRLAGRMTKQRMDVLVNSPDWSRLPAHVQHDMLLEVQRQNREIAANVIMAKYPQIPASATRAQRDRFKNDTPARPRKIQQEQ